MILTCPQALAPCDIRDPQYSAGAQMIQSSRCLKTHICHPVIEAPGYARLNALAQHWSLAARHEPASEITPPGLSVRKTSPLKKKIELVSRHVGEQPAAGIMTNP